MTLSLLEMQRRAWEARHGLAPRPEPSDTEQEAELEPDDEDGETDERAADA